ncbi:hypothetical protein [Burkholderia ubonensis]|nr:hypothetical protein [Burkholderia ubonensis]
MMNKILGLLAQADAVLTPTLVEVKAAPVSGQPDQQVVSLRWKDSDNCRCGTFLTEEGLSKATFDEKTQSFQVPDFEGDVVALQLMAKGTPLTPMSAPSKQDDEEPVYVLIQEGGSSYELYIHAHHTLDEADADRVSCEDNGAYRTSDIIEVPTSLADHPGFYELAEQLVCSVVKTRSPVPLGPVDDVKIPASIASHPQFYKIAGQLVAAIDTLDFPGE